MKYILLFEKFTAEEDIDFLNDIKDRLLEYTEKYNLLEAGTKETHSEDYDPDIKNGLLKCFLVKKIGKDDTFIDVEICIDNENTTKEFFDSGDDKKIIKRLESLGYKCEMIRKSSNSIYSLFYQFYIYR